MLYLFSGDDIKNKLTSYEKFLQQAPKGAEIFRLTPKEFDANSFEGYLSSSGLFFKQMVISLSLFLENTETKEYILERLPELAESANWFVFVEGRLNKPVIDAFKKAKGEVQLFEAPKVMNEKFNSFSLANSFGVKDKLNLWIHFREAVNAGVAMEELAGILFWKAKDMLMKKSYGKFTEAELKSCVEKLSYVLPEARQQGKDAEIAFEQFLLEVF